MLKPGRLYIRHLQKFCIIICIDFTSLLSAFKSICLGFAFCRRIQLNGTSGRIHWDASNSFKIILNLNGGIAYHLTRYTYKAFKFLPKILKWAWTHDSPFIYMCITIIPLLQGSLVAVKNIQRRSIHLTRDVLKDLKTVGSYLNPAVRFSTTVYL